MKKRISNLTASTLSRASALLVMLLCLSVLRSHGQSNPTSFKIAIKGEGQPIILIPGLSCSGEVWHETVERYKKDYKCHVLTLAGFAGQPPIQSEKFLETVCDELASYIRQQKLNKPIVVGHSLGGFVGMWLGAKEPDLVGALVIVEKLQPDLLFLDIQMPGRDGFELLEQLEHVPQVIFTTAYNEYAFKAFEYNALDYLLKPIQPQRLDDAIAKVQGQFEKRQQQEKPNALLHEHDQVFVRDGERCWFIKLSEVKLMEVCGNYSRLYFRAERPLI